MTQIHTFREHNAIRIITLGRVFCYTSFNSKISKKMRELARNTYDKGESYGYQDYINSMNKIPSLGANSSATIH
jgi:hypothetical protein